MTTLITGGTGSFGHAYLKQAIGDVVIFSRDEEKQRRMAQVYDAPTFTRNGVDFALGDVRDLEALRAVMRRYGVTRVFHAAALKQVPGCEGNVLEAVKTNVLGTDNVCRAASEVGARVVVLSTDKAVEPVGVMGASKFLAEGIARNWGVNSVRYGNVVGSRGSIIPLWREQVARGGAITITDPGMTRFLITLSQAVELVETAFDAEPDGSVFVRKSPAATVEQIARAFAPGHPTRVVGIRPGEKRHEDLVAEGELVTEYEDYLRVGPGGTPGCRWSSETAPRPSPELLAWLLQQAPE